MLRPVQPQAGRGVPWVPCSHQAWSECKQELPSKTDTQFFLCLLSGKCDAVLQVQLIAIKCSQARQVVQAKYAGGSCLYKDALLPMLPTSASDVGAALEQDG